MVRVSGHGGNHWLGRGQSFSPFRVCYSWLGRSTGVSRVVSFYEALDAANQVPALGACRRAFCVFRLAALFRCRQTRLELNRQPTQAGAFLMSAPAFTDCLQNPPTSTIRSHALVIRSAAAFGRQPVNYLVWIHDVAGFAVDAV